MTAMRLTRNEYHRKLRAPIGDISDWFVNADVSDFLSPLPCLGDVLGPEGSSTFRASRLPAASHDYLLPLTTICCPHEFLLSPTTTCCLHNSLVATAWRNT